MSDSKLPHFVGIDVAQDHLDVHVLPGEHVLQIPNEESGFQQVRDFLAQLNVERVVLEATGKLEAPIAAALNSAGLTVVIVNPRQVPDFAKATGQLAKTDRLDARVIAEFARSVPMEARPIRDQQSQNLEDLLARRRQIVGMIAAERNRLSRARGKTIKDIRSHIDWLEKRLKHIDDDLEKEIKASPIWREREELFRSVPGAGPVLARTLLINLPEIGTISHRSLAKLMGVAPLNCDSGTLRGQRRTWGGRANVRRALYMAAVSATLHNPIIRAYYRKLRSAGKKPKVALVACMRKLLTILNAITRSGMPWHPLNASS